jgi:hypothetical protein
VLLTFHTFWPDEWCLPSSSFLALNREVHHVFVFFKIEPVPLAGVGGVGEQLIRCDSVKVVLDLIALRGRGVDTGIPLAIVQLLIKFVLKNLCLVKKHSQIYILEPSGLDLCQLVELGLFF